MILITELSTFPQIKSRGPVELKCKQCSKHFFKPKNEVQKVIKGTRHETLDFCSPSCGHISRTTKVLLTCEVCSKQFYRGLCKAKTGKKFCSSKCSNGERRGDRHTEESRRKISEALSGRKYVVKYCKCCNSILEDHSKSVCSSLCRSKRFKLHWTEDKKKTQSLQVSKQYENGKPVYGGKTKWFDYENLRVQGSYELRACSILDKWKNNGTIANWSYARKRIKYIGLDGNPHTYITDFQITTNSGALCILETKGWIKDTDWLKWESTINQGYTLIVWMKKELDDYENGAIPNFVESSIPWDKRKATI